MVDERFYLHNLHQEGGISVFQNQDPNLRRLQNQSLKYSSELVLNFPINDPCIMTLTGGRQIGKTTLLKQWMLHLLQKKISAENIFYLTGEMIDDHHALVRIVQQISSSLKSSHLWYLIIDEVTYIQNWDKGIKFLADLGIFENCIVMLTGSDQVILQESRRRFPGRRGHTNHPVDFHFHPLSFLEFVQLYRPLLLKSVQEHTEEIFKLFSRYLLHGGFLTAINEYEKTGNIASSTYQTYSDWIRGDVVKKNKSENNLQEIFTAIMKTYGSQVSWNSLCDHMSIQHPQTVIDYIEILQSMDVLIVQQALREDKLSPAPKKPKKIHFKDPFIYRALQFWLKNQIQIEDSFLVESIAVANFARNSPVYYIKADGEVDIAIVTGNKFLPIEIKWTNQLHANELKQILKYKNGQIWSKKHQYGKFESVQVQPLPLALLNTSIFI